MTRLTFIQQFQCNKEFRRPKNTNPEDHLALVVTLNGRTKRMTDVLGKSADILKATGYDIQLFTSQGRPFNSKADLFRLIELNTAEQLDIIAAEIDTSHDCGAVRNDESRSDGREREDGLQASTLREVSLPLDTDRFNPDAIQLLSGDTMLKQIGINMLSFPLPLSSKLADTPITHAQFARIFKLKEAELSQIITDPMIQLQQSIRESMEKEFSEQMNSPMVFINHKEAKAILALLGLRLPMRAEFSAAMGNKKYPWGDEQPTEQIIYNKGKRVGTSSVYRQRKTGLGFYALTGIVSQWTSDKNDNKPILIGTSWFNCSDDRLKSSFYSYYEAGEKRRTFGFRPAL